MESELTSHDSLDSTTDKFLLVKTVDVEEHRPKPIPSILRRDAPAQAKTAAPTFTWPIAPTKPRDPGAWKPPAPPARLAKAPEPVWEPPAPTPKAVAIAKLELASSPVAASARVVETKPIAAEPLTIATLPALIAVEPEPAPIVAEPAPAPIAATPAPMAAESAPRRSPKTRRDDQPTVVPAAREFGAGMLQARTRRAKQTAAHRDVSSVSIAQSGAAPQFGAGILQARKSRGKLVVALVLAAATIAALYFAFAA